jgi:membrane-bound lytic murein transglycosylase D
MKKILCLSFFIFAFLFGNAQPPVEDSPATTGTTSTGIAAETPTGRTADKPPVADTVTIVNGDEVIDPDINNNLDSLLSIWYLQRALYDSSGLSIEFDEAHETSDLPDSVYINRIKRMPVIIDLPYNHVVRNSIVYYTQRIPEKSEMILGLAQHYLPIIEEILDKYDMPLELRAMAIIESALNPRAVSRQKAKGMWQFIYPTALRYNLKINSYMDERLDPIASTHAAAQYLKDLYAIFGDWSLAIAAYNCGDGNVRKAIRRSGGKRDYWDIYPYLPKETRGYVPNFVAASYLLEYYKDHKLQPKAVSMPAQVDTFIISQMLHFEQVSEVIGIPVDELRDFNPQYLHDIVPGASGKCVLRVPFEYTGLFAEKEKEIYSYKDSVYFNPDITRRIAQHHSAASGGRSQVIHRVRSGETLSTIAQRYRVKISDIQYWNNLKGTRINAGQKLIVNARGVSKPAANTKTTAAATRNAAQTSGSHVIHVVKKGENLWKISQLYDDVTFYDIMKLNGFTEKTKIFPGDKIKVK